MAFYLHRYPNHSSWIYKKEKVQLNLEKHKANIFEKFPYDESKQSVIFIPGAGMDHRILSMFDLSNLKDDFNILGLDLPGHGYTSGPIVNSIQEHSEFCLKIFKR